jgi:hypothetical protein
LCDAAACTGEARYQNRRAGRSDVAVASSKMEVDRREVADDADWMRCRGCRGWWVRDASGGRVKGGGHMWGNCCSGCTAPALAASRHQAPPNLRPTRLPSHHHHHRFPHFLHTWPLMYSILVVFRLLSFQLPPKMPHNGNTNGDSSKLVTTSDGEPVVLTHSRTKRRTSSRSASPSFKARENIAQQHEQSPLRAATNKRAHNNNNRTQSQTKATTTQSNSQPLSKRQRTSTSKSTRG